MEEQEGSVNFKFGVLYAKNGQKSDDEMFSNGKLFSELRTNLKIKNLLLLDVCYSLKD